MQNKVNVIRRKELNICHKNCVCLCSHCSIVVVGVSLHKLAWVHMLYLHTHTHKQTSVSQQMFKWLLSESEAQIVSFNWVRYEGEHHKTCLYDVKFKFALKYIKLTPMFSSYEECVFVPQVWCVDCWPPVVHFDSWLRPEQLTSAGHRPQQFMDLPDYNGFDVYKTNIHKCTCITCAVCTCCTTCVGTPVCPARGELDSESFEWCEPSIWTQIQTKNKSYKH